MAIDEDGPQPATTHRYLSSDIDRHGNVRHYLRRPNDKKRRLRSTPGTAEFDAEYDAAMRTAASRGFGGSVVYFVKSGEALKIGVSSDLARRIAYLQTGSPNKLVLVLTLPGDASTERALHQRFSEARTQGEWFMPTDALREFIRSERHRTRWANPIESPERERSSPTSKIGEKSRTNWLGKAK